MVQKTYSRVILKKIVEVKCIILTSTCHTFSGIHSSRPNIGCTQYTQLRLLHNNSRRSKTHSRGIPNPSKISKSQDLGGPCINFRQILKQDKAVKRTFAFSYTSCRDKPEFHQRHAGSTSKPSFCSHLLS